jgi:hypothetical protein
MRQLPSLDRPTTRFTRTSLGLSSLQFTEDPDRVRSFGGYNTATVPSRAVVLRRRRGRSKLTLIKVSRLFPPLW